jgi:hypothetical protein
MDEISQLLIGISFSLKARDAVMKTPIGLASRNANALETDRFESVCGRRLHYRRPRNNKRSSISTSSKRQLILSKQAAVDQYGGESNNSQDDNNCGDEDDDDTASTVSLLADDTSCSSAECGSGSSATVTFCAPLVTEIYERPVTTPDEKAALYYTEREYREFRRDFVYGQPRRLVHFHSDVVTAVLDLPPSVISNLDESSPSTCASDLYYSESDLQGYVGLCAWVCLSSPS